MNIGERIREKRNELGLSQAELGKRLSITGAAVSKAELSKNDMTTDRIQKFADALGCSVSYLMGWDSIAWNPKTQDIYVDEDSSILVEIKELDLSFESMSNLLMYAKYLKSQEEL